jgi:hypothetical protein
MMSAYRKNVLDPYDTVLHSNRVLIHTTAWMHIDKIMLSEKAQAQ